MSKRLKFLWCGRFLVSLIAICSARAAEDVHDPRGSDKQEPAITLPYGVDHEAALEPIERVDRQRDDHTRLRVEFNGIKGDRVPGYLYLPADDEKPHPAVLLQYGSGGNKNTNYIVALGEQFVSRGFVVLTIDAPMRGERRVKSERGWRKIFSENGRFTWYLGDYSRAIDYLMSRPEVDRERIGYTGISWGAITGITFVAHEPRVRAMASIVGGANFLGSLKVELAPQTQVAARRVDPIYHVALIAPRPLLLLNVTRDQLVPRFFSESLHKAAGDDESVKKMWLDTDHFFTGVDRYAVLDDVIDFMEQALTQQPPQSLP